MDLNCSQNPHKNLKISKILLAVLCALVTPFASGGAVFTVLTTAVFTYILFDENFSNKTKLCIVFTIGLTFVSIFLKTKLLVFLIQIVNIILPSAVLSYMFGKKITDLADLVKGVTLANLAVSLLDLAKLKFYDKYDLIKDGVTPYFDKIKPVYTELLNQNKAIIPSEAFEAFNSVFDMIQDFTVRFIPFMLIAVSALTAFFIIKLSAYFIGTSLKKSAYSIASSFEEYTTPHHSGILMIILFVVILSGANNSFASACYNLIAYIFAEYIICGTAIILYIVKKHTKAKGVLKLFIFCLCIFLICVLSAFLSFIGGLNILVLLGMFDSNFNFRKLEKLKRPRILK